MKKVSSANNSYSNETTEYNYLKTGKFGHHSIVEVEGACYQDGNNPERIAEKFEAMDIKGAAAENIPPPSSKPTDGKSSSGGTGKFKPKSLVTAEGVQEIAGIVDERLHPLDHLFEYDIRSSFSVSKTLSETKPVSGKIKKKSRREKNRKSHQDVNNVGNVSLDNKKMKIITKVLDDISGGKSKELYVDFFKFVCGAIKKEYNMDIKEIVEYIQAGTSYNYNQKSHERDEINIFYSILQLLSQISGVNFKCHSKKDGCVKNINHEKNKRLISFAYTQDQWEWIQEINLDRKGTVLEGKNDHFHNLLRISSRFPNHTDVIDSHSTELVSLDQMQVLVENVQEIINSCDDRIKEAIEHLWKVLYFSKHYNDTVKEIDRCLLLTMKILGFFDGACIVHFYATPFFLKECICKIISLKDCLLKLVVLNKFLSLFTNEQFADRISSIDDKNPEDDNNKLKVDKLIIPVMKAIGKCLDNAMRIEGAIQIKKEIGVLSRSINRIKRYDKKYTDDIIAVANEIEVNGLKNINDKFKNENYVMENDSKIHLLKYKKEGIINDIREPMATKNTQEKLADMVHIFSELSKQLKDSFPQDFQELVIQLLDAIDKCCADINVSSVYEENSRLKDCINEIYTTIKRIRKYIDEDMVDLNDRINNIKKRLGKIKNKLNEINHEHLLHSMDEFLKKDESSPNPTFDKVYHPDGLVTTKEKLTYAKEQIHNKLDILDKNNIVIAGYKYLNICHIYSALNDYKKSSAKSLNAREKLLINEKKMVHEREIMPTMGKEYLWDLLSTIRMYSNEILNSIDASTQKMSSHPVLSDDIKSWLREQICTMRDIAKCMMDCCQVAKETLEERKEWLGGLRTYKMELLEYDAEDVETPIQVSPDPQMSAVGNDDCEDSSQSPPSENTQTWIKDLSKTYNDLEALLTTDNTSPMKAEVLHPPFSG